MKGTCEQIPFYFFLKFMMLTSSGGLILALQRAITTARPEGRYRKHCYWLRYKAVLLESSLLESSACSLIYFCTTSSVIFIKRICLRTNQFPGYPMILSGLFSARKPNSHHSHLVFLKLLLLFYFLDPSVLMDSQHYCTYCCDHKSDPEDECVCSTVLFRDEQQDTYQDIYCKQYDFHYNV